MNRRKAYGNRVNIVKTVKSENKWITVPVQEKNGKIVRDHVLIRGKDEHHPEGRYYLDWYEDGKKRRQAVPDFDDLVPAARAKFAELQARSAGILIELPSRQVRSGRTDPAAKNDPNRLSMTVAVEQYLDYCKTQRSLRTYRTYRPALLSYFLPSYTRTKEFVDEVVEVQLDQVAAIRIGDHLPGVGVRDALPCGSRLRCVVGVFPEVAKLAGFFADDEVRRTGAELSPALAAHSPQLRHRRLDALGNRMAIAHPDFDDAVRL
jgi:hypothetical protein